MTDPYWNHDVHCRPVRCLLLGARFRRRLLWRYVVVGDSPAA
ncbi:hypothetical protein OG496_36590 [Streptomyces sp. NBC_00988]|nr:hypothetical protein OG496_36590 [Streptomyces sp. NBC_00988]